MSSTARTGWWRRSIRFRILVIAWVPSLLLLATGMAFSGVLAHQGSQTERFTDRFVADAPPFSTFSVMLMSERRTSELYLAQPATHRAELAVWRQKVDAQSGPAMRAAAGRAAMDPAVYTQVVDDLNRSFAQLKSVRARVDSRQADLLEVSDYYSGMIGAIAHSLYLIARAEPVPRAALGLSGAVSLFQATDAYVNADGFALAATLGTGLSPAEYRRYGELLGGARVMIEQAQPLLDPEPSQQLTALRRSDAWLRLSAAQDAVLLRGPATAAGPAGGGTAKGGQSGAVGRRTVEANAVLDEKAWSASSMEVLSGFGRIGTTLSVNSAALSGDSGHSQLTRAWALGIAQLVLAVAVLLVTTLTSRGLVRRLARLRADTLNLANGKLPGIVQRLRDGEKVDLTTELPPLEYGEDEIGQVADAFNHAQRTAVAAAVREAETRAGLRSVFIDIAHRSQVIIYRQLKVLDQAERTQEDPDQLSLLFQLDHLATRARRNAENLIILGGGQPGRQWRNPVPLLQVVRSAISEAQDYARVTVGSLPRMTLVGGAVSDLIHMLAELVDNATSFSPPMSRVEVRGNVVGRGVVLEIEDQGLGIEPQQLARFNEMLSEPPDFQVMALRDEPRLGIFVVAQLASRHGVRVTLTPSPAYGGTRVVVLLPTELIETMEGPSGQGAAPPALAAPRVLAGPDGGPLSSGRRSASPPQPVLDRLNPERIALRHSADLSGEPASAKPEPRRSAVEPTPLPGDLFPPASDPRVADRPQPQAPPQPSQPPSQQPPPSQPPQPYGTPPRGTVPPASPLDGATGQAPSAPGTPGGGKPALPRRTRQTHLAPQLRTGPVPIEDLPEATPSDPEQARRRMTAFQHGTQRGRREEPPPIQPPPPPSRPASSSAPEAPPASEAPSAYPSDDVRPPRPDGQPPQ